MDIALGIVLCLGGIAWFRDVLWPDEMTIGSRRVAAGLIAVLCFGLGYVYLFS